MATASITDAPARLRAAFFKLLLSMSIPFVTLRRSYDDETESGRSKERYRRAALTGVVGGLSKGARILSSIVTVGVTVGYLGGERFGLWMSLSSLIALVFGFADLGLASALQNEVSLLSGRDATADLRKLVSTAVPLLLAIPFALVAVLFLPVHFAHWAGMFNIHTALAINEVRPSVEIMGLCYLAAIPLSVSSRIQWGFQEGYRANAWDAAAAMLGLLATVAVARLRMGLPALVLANAGAPLAVNIVNCVSEFGVRRKWLIPRLMEFEWSIAQALLQNGFQLLLIALGSCMTSAAPILVVSNRFGASEGGPFALVFRVLAIPLTLISILGGSLWPAYTDANARKDYGWIRRTLFRSVRAVLFIVAPIIALLGVVTPWVVRFWTQGHIMPSIAASCGISLFVTAITLQSLLWPPLIALGRFTCPALSMLLAGVLSFLPILAPASRISIPAIPIWVAGCVLLSGVPMGFELRSRLRQWSPE